MTRSIPALPVRNVAAGAAFYRERLGFAIVFESTDFVIAKRDDVELHLWAASDQGWESHSPSAGVTPVRSGAETFIAGTASCRIEVQDLDSLFHEYRQQGVLYQPDTRVDVQPWGTREFPALDHERNLLTFFEST